MAPQYAPGGIDYLYRRPRVYGVAAPDSELAIVDHRMHQVKPDYSFTDSFCDTLSVVLTAMHADDRNLVWKPFFELQQLREDVNAVDSAVSPEIEQEDLASKVSQSERAPAGVYPVEPSGKLGSSHRRLSHARHS